MSSETYSELVLIKHYQALLGASSGSPQGPLPPSYAYWPLASALGLDILRTGLRGLCVTLCAHGLSGSSVCDNQFKAQPDRYEI